MFFKCKMFSGTFTECNDVCSNLNFFREHKTMNLESLLQSGMGLHLLLAYPREIVWVEKMLPEMLPDRVHQFMLH